MNYENKRLNNKPVISSNFYDVQRFSGRRWLQGRSHIRR